MSVYFDIEAILSEEFVVPCTVSATIEKCGFLETNDRSQGETALLANTKVELPFWLAAPLKKEELVTIQLPPMYTTVILENLQIDAPHCNLRKKQAFYFENGNHLAVLLKNASLQQSLLTAYVNRWRKLIEFAKSEGGKSNIRTSAGRFYQRLTYIERKAYEQLKDERLDVQRYFAGEFYPSDLGCHHPKRRKIEANNEV